MHITAALATDVGRHRQVNEDSGYVGDAIWVVADGMGGHAAGDVASMIAIGIVRQLDQRGDITGDDLHDLVHEASERIRAYGDENPESYGLGTTIAGLAAVDVNGPCWAVFNVGDSRVYRYLDGRLERATIDHTEVELLVRGGVITADEARRHPARNIVTQSLGSYPPPYADVWVLPVTPGERFVICSDGLTGEVTDGDIAATLAELDDPHQAADELVEMAVDAGGHDNITVVVVDPAGEADDDEGEQTVIRPRAWAES